MLGLVSNFMPKPKSVFLSCACGTNFNAGFPSGVIGRTAKCPACLNYIKTDGTSKPPTPKVCAGCKRPLLNNKHCTYCGRPVSEKEAQSQIALAQ